MARPRARLILHRSPALWLLLLMLLAPLTGCSVRLIQPYDDAIEKTVLLGRPVLSDVDGAVAEAEAYAALGYPEPRS